MLYVLVLSGRNLSVTKRRFGTARGSLSSGVNSKTSKHPRRTKTLSTQRRKLAVLQEVGKRNEEWKEYIRKSKDTASYARRTEYIEKEVMKRTNKWRKISNKEVLKLLAN